MTDTVVGSFYIKTSNILVNLIHLGLVNKFPQGINMVFGAFILREASLVLKLSSVHFLDIDFFEHNIF